MKLFSFLRRKKETRNLDIQQTNTGGSVSNAIKNKVQVQGFTLAPLFAAVNIISNSCAILPWKFLTEDGKQISKSHYLYHLFDNATVDKFISIKNAIKDTLIDGNGFLYIERNVETGKPITLRYVPRTEVTIFKDNLNQKLYYLCPNISSRYITMDDMIHFKMHTSDGLIGYGIPFYARKTIEVAGYTEETISEYMQSGGSVHGILTPNSTNPAVPTLKKQVDEIRKAWDEARSLHGTTTIILPADMKFTQLSTNARDAALIDTRMYNLQEIARWFNISPILLGDLSHTQYGSISETQKEYLNHTLQPYLIMMETELNKKLIMPSRIGKDYIDLDENFIIAVDKEKQANYLTNFVTKGIITSNEARAELGLPPIEGGDKIQIAYSKIEDNSLTNEQKQKDDKNEEQQ